MLETIQFTLKLLKKRPIRSLLTIFQIALGVWVLAIILSLNFQATSAFSKIQASYGSTLARLEVSQVIEQDNHKTVNHAAEFTLKDLKTIQRNEDVEATFIYQGLWEQRILVDDVAYQVSQIGETTPGYQKGMNLEIIEGEFFTDLDLEQENKVVLISKTIKEQLFPTESALGKKINLSPFGEGLEEWEIIGVYLNQSPMLEFFISDAHILYPLGFQTYSGAIFWEPSYSHIYLKAKPNLLYQAVEGSKLLLKDRSFDDFEINAEYFADTHRYFTANLEQMTLFLGIFAFIAILISALGILSIMLVSVLERTKEIGLRKALGAAETTIIWQILMESFLFTLIGSLVGLGVAYFSAESLINLLGQELTYPRLTNLGGLHLKAALISLVLVLAIGQLFALYPALQGAKMSPVDALRDS